MIVHVLILWGVIAAAAALGVVDRPRLLLLQTYAAADAFAYTDLKRSPHGEELIRGEPARGARHDARPCLMPPTGSYRPIFRSAARRGAVAVGRRGLCH